MKPWEIGSLYLFYIGINCSFHFIRNEPTSTSQSAREYPFFAPLTQLITFTFVSELKLKLQVSNSLLPQRIYPTPAHQISQVTVLILSLPHKIHRNSVAYKIKSEHLRVAFRALYVASNLIFQLPVLPL